MSSVFFVTFAPVKLMTSRHLAARMLLAVFVPMLLMVSLHVHDGATTVSAECAGCVHHNCHGHLAPTASWSCDCVLCQFLSLAFVAVGTISIVAVNKVAGVGVFTRRRNACVAYCGIVGLRAPPV